MSIKENPRKYRIYNKTTRQWTEVTDNIYRDHMRFHDAFRKRAQSHGQCVCPKNKFWLCDADCYTCVFIPIYLRVVICPTGQMCLQY